MRTPTKKPLLLGLAGLLFAGLILSTTVAQPMSSESYKAFVDPENLSETSIPFIANVGQFDPEVQFAAQLFSGPFAVTSEGLHYSIAAEDHTLVLREQFVDSTGVPIRLAAQGQQPGQAEVNYFVGNNQDDWKQHVSTFHFVGLGELYEGISVDLFARGTNVEKLYTILPTSTPDIIRMDLGNEYPLTLNDSGELIISSNKGDISFSAPKAWQADGLGVDVSYKLYGNGSYGFSVSDYDRSQTLYIDPLLAGTYIGGFNSDFGFDVHVDSGDNIFITGNTLSSSYPVTPGVYSTPYQGFDTFVSKLSNDGSTLLASTIIGGNGDDTLKGITTDSNGNIIVVGSSYRGISGANTYPTTGGAYDTSANSGRVVVITKLNNTLTSLLGSTFYGPDNFTTDGLAITTDSSDNIFITGTTNAPSLPTSGYDTSINGSQDVYVAKFNNTLTTLLGGTFLGGTLSTDNVNDIASDTSGNIFVTGGTFSSDFPTTGGAYDTTFGGSSMGYVAKFTNSLGALSASTFLGGDTGSDSIQAITTDTTGNVYVGSTTSSTDFPYLGGYDSTRSTSTAGAVSSLNNSLTTLTSSTYVDGVSFIAGIDLDTNNNIFIGGTSSSNSFPIVNGFQTSHSGSGDAVYALYTNDLSTLKNSSFYGGSGSEIVRGVTLNSLGKAIIAGDSTSTSGIATLSGYDSTHNGSEDIFVGIIEIPTLEVTVEQSGTQNDPTSTIPIVFEATFSEPITVGSFTSGDITVTNGTVTTGPTEIAPNNGTTFSFSVTPVLQGNVSASIAPGLVSTSGGVLNEASTSIDNNVDYDLGPATLSITRLDPSPTNSDTQTFRLTFSEDVENLDITDFATSSVLGRAPNQITTVTPNSVFDLTYTAMIGESRDSLALLNANGTLDRSFENITFSNSGNIKVIKSQSDGKLLLGGTFTTVNGQPYSGVIRLNTDLTLDTSFNPQVTGFIVEVNDIEVLSSGKILISGLFDTVGGQTYTSLARLNSDGTVDTGFNNINSTANIHDMVVDSSDRIYVGGTFSTINGTSRSSFARLNANGTLDVSFPNINLTSTIGPNITSVIQLSNGDLVLGGNFNGLLSQTRQKIARITNTGTLVSGFDMQLSSGDSINALALLPNGQFYIGGRFSTVQGNTYSGIARINDNNTVDTSFTNPAFVSSSYPGVAEIDILPDGDLLASGTFTSVASTTMTGLARLNADGTLDTSLLNPDLSPSFSPTRSAHLLPDGGYLVGGEYGSAGTIYNSLSQNGTYGVEFSPSMNITDTSGNSFDEVNDLAVSETYDVDTTGPTVTIDHTGTDPTSTSPTLFSVVFSTPIVPATFTSGDVTIGGTATTGTPVITEVTPNDGTTFEVAVPFSTEGTITATIPAGVVEDTDLGNTNAASTSTDNEVTTDLTPPNAEIYHPNQTDPSNDDPFVFRLRLSEETDPSTVTPTDFAISGSATASITSTNVGTLQGFEAFGCGVFGGWHCDYTFYDIAVTGMLDGETITLTMTGDVEDIAGNTNNPVVYLDNSFTYDNTPPTAVFNKLDPDPTASRTLRYEVVFDEPVSNVDASDFTIYFYGAAGYDSVSIINQSTTTTEVTITGVYGNSAVVDAIDISFSGSTDISDAAGNVIASGFSPQNSYELIGGFAAEPTFLLDPDGDSTNEVQYWFSADRGTSCNTDGCSVVTWLDQAGVIPALERFNNFMTLVFDYTNFNPAITPSFSQWNGVHTLTFPNDMYIVTTPPASPLNARETFIGYNDDDWALDFPSNVPTLRSDSNTTPLGGAVTALVPNLISLQNTDTGSLFSTSYFNNGLADGSNPHSVSYSSPNLTTFQMGRGTIGPTTYGYDGSFEEIIVFNDTLSTAQRNIVESYLAIKYGITLDQSADNDSDGTIGTDYTLSNGATVYDDADKGSLNFDHIHDIAGIGRDDGTGLYQSRSRSENTDSLITIEAQDPMTNLSALIWANDDDSIAAWSSSNPYPGHNEILPREWKVFEEGDVGPVKLYIDQSDLPATTDPIVLIVDNDGNFSGGGGLGIYSMTLNGSTYESDAVNLSDLTYFSFATDIIPPTAPTVNTLSTTDSTPILTGTWDEDLGHQLEILVDSITYQLGVDTELTSDGSGNWTLDLSAKAPAFGSGVYEVVVTTTDAGNNTATDSSTNELSIDNTAPTLSITRQNPTGEYTNNTSVTFRATFDEDVNNVTLDDFTSETTGTATGSLNTITTIQVNRIYDITVTGIGGDGGLSIGFSGTENIEDIAGNPFNPGTDVTLNESYIIDNISPNVTVTRLDSTPTNADENRFLLTFDEDVTRVDALDFVSNSNFSRFATVVEQTSGNTFEVSYTRRTPTNATNAVVVHSNGMPNTDFLSFNVGGAVNDSLKLSDNSLIVAGSFTSIGGQPRNRIARVNTDGTIDPSYNPNVNGTILGITPQDDGKIIIFGSFSTVGGINRANIARLNTDGTLDTSFTADASSTVHTVLVEPNGDMLMGGGFTTVNGQTRNRLARVNSLGVVDGSYDPNANNVVRTIARTSGGEYVIGGEFTFIGGQSRNRLALLDASGVVQAPNYNSNNTVYEVILESDDDILVRGNFTSIGGQSRNYVARLSLAGVVDAGFNPNPNDLVYSMYLNEDGTMFIGGAFISVAGKSASSIAMLNTDGSLNSNFIAGINGTLLQTVTTITPWINNDYFLGGQFSEIGYIDRNYIARMDENGIVDMDFDPSASSAVSPLAEQSDGKIILGRDFATVGGETHTRIARTLTNGDVDSAFTASSDGSISAIEVQTDDKILLGGSFNNINGTGHTNIARLNSDGSIDGSFTASANSSVRAIALEPDGDIVIGGFFSTVNGSPRNMVARMNSAGILDATFTPSANGVVNDVIILADDKILITGAFTSVSGHPSNGVARLNSDGSVDTSFTANLFSPSKIAVQSDGKVVVVGGFTSPTNRVARLNTDGSFDTSFVVNANSIVDDVEILSSGDILLSGNFTTINGQTRNRIAKVDSNGNLVPAFTAGAKSRVFNMFVQSNGDVVFGGEFEGVLSSRVNETYTLAFDTNQNIIDLAGNPLLLPGGVISTESYTIEIDGPTVSLEQGSGQADPTSISPIVFDVVFGEAINTGTFTDTDIVVSGTATTGTPVIVEVAPNDGTTFEVQIPVTGEGTIIASIPPYAVEDTVGDPNTASTSVDNTVTYDTTGPSAAITRLNPLGANTNATTVDFQITFDEDVNNVTLTDFVPVTTGTVIGTGSSILETTPNRVYTLSVSVSGTGTLSLDAEASHDIEDTSGNPFDETTNLTAETYTVDTDAPTVTITRQNPTAAATTANDVTFRVTFNEPVNNVGGADFVISGGATATQSSTSTITPNLVYDIAYTSVSGDGTLNLDFAGGQDIVDDFGNAFDPGTGITAEEEYTIDNTPPTYTVTRLTPTDSLVGPDTVVFRFTFSEDVVNFDSVVDLSGAPTGTVSASPQSVSQVDPQNYDVTIDILGGDGTYTAQVNTNFDATKVQDLVGLLANQTPTAFETYTIDSTPPTTPTVTSQTTNDTTPVITGTWDEQPGYTLSVTIDGTTYILGTDTELSSTTGNWTLDLTGTPALTAGTYDVAVSSADSVNNISTDATTDELVIELSAPTVSIARQNPLSASTNADTVDFRLTFNEAVQNVDTTDFSLGTTGTVNGSLTSVSTVTPGTVYDVTVTTIIGDGDLALTFAGGQNIADLAGNSFDPGTGITSEESYSIDNTGPTPSVEQASAQNDPVQNGPVLFTITFDEPIALPSFDNTDLTVNGSATTGTPVLTEIAPNDGTTFAVSIPTSSDGTVILSLASTVLTDLVGNNNLASVSTDNAVTIDSEFPTVTINQAPGQLDPTNSSPILFDVLFSEPIATASFTDTDIAFGGTATVGTPVIAEVAPSDGTTFQVTIPTTGEGTVIPSLGTGAVLDLAGNSSAQSTSTDNTVTFDTTAPSITSILRGTPTGTYTNSASVSFTVTFDEDVQNVDITDFVLLATNTVNGTITSVTPLSLSQYTITLTGLSGNGTVTIDTALANDITDVASNPLSSTIGTQQAYILDTIAPTVPTVDALTTPDTTPRITGRYEQGTELTVTMDGIPYILNTDPELRTDGAGNWILDLSALTPELLGGIYDVQVSTTDRAGNTTVDATTNEVTINTAQPDQEVTLTLSSNVANASNVEYHFELTPALPLPNKSTIALSFPGNYSSALSALTPSDIAVSAADLTGYTVDIDSANRIIRIETASLSSISTTVDIVIGDGVAGGFGDLNNPANNGAYGIGVDTFNASGDELENSIAYANIGGSSILVNAQIVPTLAVTLSSPSISFTVDPAVNNGQDVSQYTELTIRSNAATYTVYASLDDGDGKPQLRYGLNTIPTGTGENTLSIDVEDSAYTPSHTVDGNISLASGSTILSSGTQTNEAKHTLYYDLDVDYLTIPGTYAGTITISVVGQF